MARRESKGFVQLEWVCPNCDGRNAGSLKTCASCGAPQPDNVQFQRAANEKIVTDEKLVQAAKRGADIHCGFCGTRNPSNAVTCSQCGGDIKEGKARQAGGVLQAAATPPKAVTCTNCGAENPGTERTCAKCGSPLPRAVAPQAEFGQVKAAAAQKGTDKKKPNWLLFGGIGALLLTCIAILFMFVFPSKSVQGTVADVHWQTSMPVQEIQAVHYSNERGSAPSDAYNVSCHTESEEVCEEKTVDQGNGFAEVVKECHTESEQFCDYTMDEWTTIQTYDLNGNDLLPVYADPSLASDQRTGNASEQFTVTFSTSDGQQTYSPNSVSEFQQYPISSVWTLKLNALGGVLSVER
ncbi:MAG TPA: zinc ribbon domain-containing protein [Anaerolineales bacterium]|nr:zinc ribbon domain-containing protein [Anaerolineales bacterium]